MTPDGTDQHSASAYLLMGSIYEQRSRVNQCDGELRGDAHLWFGNSPVAAEAHIQAGRSHGTFAS